MKRISNALDQMKDHYDVVVIGSGYGGGVAASRLARANKSVCLLERGRERIAGEFPNTLVKATEEMQLDTHEKKIGSPTGMFNFHVNKDISVLVGCGLGGTSLINANVSLQADPRVFENGNWPKELVSDIPNGLEKGYERAREMLKPNPYPDNFPTLNKLEAHRKSGAYIGQPFYKTPINVNFEDKTNHVGVEQKACNNCGDCVSGCNYTAKNTTQMNYLPDAWNHGAEIYTECNVAYIEKKNGKWLVFFNPVDLGRGKFDAPPLFVSADHVVVSAGTIGSTEIMLRSAQKGLSLSPMLGQRFSGNGDVLAFAYDTQQKINGIGYGHKNPAGHEPCGPCITSVIDTRETSKDYRDGMIIEEGSIPGAIAKILPASFAAISVAEGNAPSLMEKLRNAFEGLVSFLFGSHRGAVVRTQTYLIMSQDSGDGVMRLNNQNRLEIDWPGVGREKTFQSDNDTLQKCTEALKGTYLENPIWTDKLGKSLVSVHPLGGCIMGENVSSGVVNHKGQAFDSSGNGVHKGLYVTDGSVIPACLGVNPLLTITAVSERNIALMAEDNGWTIDYTLPSAPRITAAEKPGIEFTETMKGFFSTSEKSDYQKGFDAGKAANSPFEFTLTIQSEDVDRLINEPDHKAYLAGTVIAPALSSAPLVAHKGIFNLFVDHKEEFNTKRMIYLMPLMTSDGVDYYCEGFKEINADHGPRIWSETSTLYITLYKGKDNTGELLGKGILHIEPSDFLKQMTTMKVTGSSSLLQSLKVQLKFGKYFAGTLYDTYGGLLKKNTYFNPDSPPRTKRPLRASAPEVHFFNTSDGVNLRLTRYQGGKKGPVILSHGLGVASSIFSTDLIDTNMVEYLFAHEYDVWLLDFRASIDLPASQMESSGDDVARYDYPAAVQTVRDLTGAADVQMVVHCYGSTTWTMAMLNGLQGVRSAVCSQVSANVLAVALTRLKSGLHMPSFLDKIGIKSLTADVDQDSNWANKLFDKVIKFYPLPYSERCDNPVCHRITFMYSLLYEHDKLNQATHDNLHELFGVANIRSLEHLTTMVRNGHVTDFDGNNVYMPHPERMAIPIRFISGEKNECFLPEGTEKTYEFLCQANGKDLYSRVVIPGYGHIDCIFGANAATDVYPHILEHLELTL